MGWYRRHEDMGDHRSVKLAMDEGTEGNGRPQEGTVDHKRVCETKGGCKSPYDCTGDHGPPQGPRRIWEGMAGYGRPQEVTEDQRKVQDGTREHRRV